MTKTTKILFEILVSALFVLISFCYWYNNSVHYSISDMEDDIVNLMDASGKRAYNQNDSLKMDGLKTQVSVNKYSKPIATEIGTLCTDFMNKWAASGGKPLPQPTVDVVKAGLQKKFTPLLDQYKNLQKNQTCAILFIDLIFVIWLCLVANTALLRDSVGDTSKLEAAAIILRNQGKTDVSVKPPFSLARTQLAVWIVIIACIYIYAVLWDQRQIGTINRTALLLMGITAATAVSAGIIDSTEIEGGIPRTEDEPSECFFKDILSDKNGISIHRFQNVVWTLVAIIIYIYRYNNPESGHENSLPDLDSTLLALTGISSATYITLKARENTPSQAATIKEVKITLAANIGLTQPQKDAIRNSPDAFKTATVELTDATGTNKIAAVPVAGSKYDFIAKDVKVGTYQKVTATWKGTLASPDVIETLTGSIDGLIDNKTSFPLNISMK